MAAAAKQLIPSVSFHAVTRYVQRMLETVLDLDEADFGNAFVMHLHCYAAGVTPAQVQTAILTPQVKQAMSLGATRIQIGEICWVIRGWNVVTMLDEPTPKQKKNLVLTRREKHRLLTRNNRKRTQRRVTA